MDNFRREADKSKSLQQMKDITEYLNRVADHIEECRKGYDGSMLIFTVAWIAWVASDYVEHGAFTNIFLIIYLLAVLYNNLRYTWLCSAKAEFSGAIKILEILGMIPPRPPRGEKKKRRMWSEMVDVVKGWATRKKEAQEKVYAPA